MGNSIKTSIDEKYAYADFAIGENKYKLRINKMLLDSGGGIFNGDGSFYTVSLKNYKLGFPTLQSTKSIEDLREIWNELTEKGFE